MDETSAADEGHEHEQVEEDDDDEEHDPHRIPPFHLNQKVFTCNLQQRGPNRGAAVETVPSKSSSSKPDRYFEAVVRQVRHHPHLTGDNRWTFLIHFKGWNARYDRWITASQLVPDTPEARQRYEQQQQEEQAEIEAQKKRQLAKKQRKQQQQAAAAKPKSAAAASQPSPDDSLASTLPFTLKTVMVEEWEKINRRGYEAPYGYDAELQQPTSPGDDTTTSNKPKGTPARSVHALPAAVTIRQLLKHFEKKSRKDFKQKQEKEQRKAAAQPDAASSPDNDTTKEAQLTAASHQFKQQVRQFCNGLAKLFEEALPTCLLYAQERPQYQHYITEQRQSGEKKVSVLDVYGCEFLLRLIVRLPMLMGPGKRPPSLVADLIVLLQQQRTACFKGSFRPPAYPHEWLDWERKYFGDPTKVDETATGDDKAVGGNDSGSDGDLFP